MSKESAVSFLTVGWLSFGGSEANNKNRGGPVLGRRFGYGIFETCMSAVDRDLRCGICRMSSHMNYVVFQLKTDTTNLNWLIGFHVRVVDIYGHLLAWFGTSADVAPCIFHCDGMAVV